MADPFLQTVVRNLQPANEEFKENIKELDDLAEFIQYIRWIERAINRYKSLGENTNTLEDEVNRARDILCEILNRRESRDLTQPFGCDFLSFAQDLKRRVRRINDTIFPPDPQPHRSSKYIPPVIQRTSKQLGEKAIKIMTKGTKYANFTSMAEWQRNKYNRRIMFIAIAWTLALSGMVISIGFLTRDFVNAQQNLAIKVERTQQQPMRLPAVTICSDEQSIPPFAEYPTDQYPGLPLFMISVFRRSNRTLSQKPGKIAFPNTLPGYEDSPVESVYVADDAEYCRKPGFDIKRETDSSSAVSLLGTFPTGAKNSTTCRYCFRIGYKQEEILRPLEKRTSASQFQPAIQIVAAKSRLFGVCQTTYISATVQTQVLLAKELREHAEKLEERGILDFNGREYSEALQTSRSSAATRHIAFYCNVYFFSGYFYPVLSQTNISYRFTGESSEPWEKVGSGPYFSPFSWALTDPMIAGPSKEVMNRDVYGFGGLRLFVEDADDASPQVVSPRSEFAILGLFDTFATFTFKKRNVLGDTEYKSQKVASQESLVRAAFVDLYTIGFDFELFEVERVFTYSSMSWSEYVTDLFEFIGLFTGICIFTLIVAPANRIKKGDEN